MTTLNSRLRFVALAVALTACSPRVRVALYHPEAGSPRAGGPVTILSGSDLPTCAFDEIGEVVGDPPGEDDKILDAMKAKVAAVGGDGILRLEKGHAGTVGMLRWQGVIFRCKKAAS